MTRDLINFYIGGAIGSALTIAYLRMKKKDSYDKGYDDGYKDAEYHIAEGEKIKKLNQEFPDQEVE